MRILVFTGLVFLVATWVGYPAVVWVVALVRRRGRPPGSPSTPRVTAILATRESDDAIRARVDNLLASDYPAHLLDVVVAIDASREGAVLPGGSGQAPVMVVAGDPPGGKATALNAAVRQATGDILVFSDTAQAFARRTVGALVDELTRHPDLVAVSGALELGAGDTAPTAASLYWKFERWLRETEARVHSPVGVTGAVYAMRRSAWVDLPTGLILDDLYVPMQQLLRGGRIGFRRDAVAVDPRQIDRRGEYRRKTRTLTGVFQLCHLMPALLAPGRNPIWAQFVFHKLMRLLTPWLLLLVLVAGAAWLLTSLPGDVALAALGTAALVAAVVLAASVRVRALVGEVFVMQAAVVQATRNALRGEWDVWQR